MSEPYEEIFDGAPAPRKTPGARHELICSRLHALVQAGVANVTSTRLLAPRTQVRVAATTTLCPDLALVTAATNKLWLARRNCQFRRSPPRHGREEADL